ncbi:MAG TPA: carboxylating nicotinate-nucleotide diphosphorylase [Gemmataceae bacterium]|nr:carboxylating nicotinate-nucleotide diphosphorylase [Gemmataceae bacterium]
MSTFSEAEKRACSRLIELAFEEDRGGSVDLTCAAVIPDGLQGQARFVARSEGVLAGLPVAPLVYEEFRVEGEAVEFEPLVEDGARLKPGTALARVSGGMHTILSAERTVLNFLQHLSGVATLTRRYVDQVSDLPVRILDTRKTTPGWRLLEKYAVRCGGGHNHRMGLHDGVMLKDNHLAALAWGSKGKGAITDAIRAVRQKFGTTVPLEVEVDTLEQLDEVLAAGPDIVLLDNMTTHNLREAVQRRNRSASGVLLEASGGVNLSTVRGIAETGVDRISIGALTHSATALDIGLDYEV